MTIMPMTIVPFETDAALLRGREELLAAMSGRARRPEERRRKTIERARALLNAATPTERILFVDTLTTLEEVPDEIAEALLAVEPGLGPTLVETAALSDRLLLELAGRLWASGLHLALAHRRRVPAAVVDRLVADGDPGVLLALVRNPGAELTTTAFEILVDRAIEDPLIDAALSRRTDLPAAPSLRRVHRPLALAAARLRDRLDRERIRRDGP